MEVTAQMVKELRTFTGAGIMDCKEALREKAGDFLEAVRFLRERGLASASKKAGRAASDGQVHALVEPGGRKGVLVEVNCETDFVARTEDFQGLLARVARHVADEGPGRLPPAAGGEPIQEAVSAAIAKLGENIIVARGDRLELPAGRAGRVVSYVHPGGRIGVLAEVACQSEAKAGSPGFAEIAKDVAMHVAASAPLYLEPGEIPQTLLDNEREILLAQQKDSGKPENILVKIVEGRFAKYKKEICLLEQPFVKDPDQTVRAMLAGRSKALGEAVSVSRFVRYQLGETAAQAGENG
ncbi:MAG: elongation factor Ts [Candidatus Tectomicrobia bacterium]|uniref:Elongation factor Ts n=1 Tax=Tectimicrobiota bacterium TaxID=2528274 RepID=A0A932ZSB8_UNCTE|nr:elongation factor Ts [Candidatus Tectomicrobia bacterium]